MAKIVVTLGKEVSFDPFETAFGYGIEECRGLVTGKVCAIHRDHKWFLVEFGDKDHLQHTAFKFDDVGKSVMLVG